MANLKPLAAIGLISALGGAVIIQHHKQAERQAAIEAAIPYKETTIPLKRLQPYFCTLKTKGNALTAQFKIKDMKNAWGGLVYHVSEDLDFYRYLEVTMSSPNISYARIEIQHEKYQAGHTIRKLLKLKKEQKTYTIDLHNLIPKLQRNHISELKLIIDSMYIRKHLFDTTTKGGTLELSDIILKTKPEEKK